MKKLDFSKIIKKKCFKKILDKKLEISSQIESELLIYINVDVKKKSMDLSHFQIQSITYQSEAKILANVSVP